MAVARRNSFLDARNQTMTRAVGVALLNIVFAFLNAGTARGDQYEIDPAHSSVVFGVKHTGMNPIYGIFSDISGRFTVDGKGTVAVSVGVESINTGNEARDKHLKTPDFFSARQFPRIEFTGKQSKRIDAQTLEVQGELKMHGVTKPITVKVETPTAKGRGGEDRAGFIATFEVRRSDFKIGAPGGLGEEVTVIVSLQGAKS
jgi:polyisoprenoid-binding protein YceI